MSETVRVACPHDCPDTCAMLVTVDDGVATKIQGDPQAPFTDGTLCTKVSHYLERTYSPDRLRYPMKRAGKKGAGQFRRISWDEALEEIATRLKALAAENPEIILRGANPVVSNLHLWSRVQAAKRRGAKVIAIDPYRSLSAEKCTQHIALLPGTDGALALGIMHVLIREQLIDRDYIERYTIGYDALEKRVLAEYPPERAAKLCGLTTEEVVQLARDYGTIKPAAIRLNYGMQRHAGGGIAARTIACLPALIGAWCDPAGGIVLSTSDFYGFDHAALERPDLLGGRRPRTINHSKLGESLPNSEIFRRLAARLGFEEACFRDSDEDICRTAVASSKPRMAGVEWETLKAQGWQKLAVPPRFAPFAEGGFPTPSGKCEFHSKWLEDQGIDPVPFYNPPAEVADEALAERYPLAFLSPPARHFLNSSFANIARFREFEREPHLDMHPRDAAARGIRDGDAVRVYNDRGAYTLRARVNGKPRPGVVVAPSVWWKKYSPDGRNANNVTPQRTADLGGGATFYDCRVQVERVDAARA